MPLWTTIELTVCIFYTFRRYSGLYFWSVLCTTWGVTIHAIGFVLKFCVPSCNWIFSTVLAEIGWVGMVSGFSIVLYSRLHLVVRSQRTLQLVLAAIVVDAFLFHVPTIVFQFGTSDKHTHKKFLPYMNVMERVQIVGFSVQEIIISAIYIYATMQMLRGSFNRRMRTTMAWLILIQIIVILCDVVVIALDYAQYFTLKAVIHSFVYAFKLQLEFVILNEFRDGIAKGGLAPRGLDALQLSSGGTNSLGSPSPSRKPAGKRWWKSQSAETAPAERTRADSGGDSYSQNSLPSLAHISTKEMPSQSFSTPIATAGGMPHGLSVHEKKRDATDDIERQYLGNWD